MMKVFTLLCLFLSLNSAFGTTECLGFYGFSLKKDLAKPMVQLTLYKVLSHSLESHFAGKSQTEGKSSLAREAAKVTLLSLISGAPRSDRLARIFAGDQLEKASRILAALSKLGSQSLVAFRTVESAAVDFDQRKINFAQFSERLDRLSQEQKDFFSSVINMRLAGIAKGDHDSYSSFLRDPAIDKLTLDRFAMGYLLLELKSSVQILEDTKDWSTERLASYALELKTMSLGPIFY